jgi:hypothetical protein
MHCKTCGDWTCELLEDVHSLVAYGTEEDTDGNFHYHDRNYRRQTWKCSKGHEFQCAGFNQCWCGWNSRNPDLIYHENKPIDPNKVPKGFKFAQSTRVLNNNHINLIVRKNNADHNCDSSDKCCNRIDSLPLRNDKNIDGALNVGIKQDGSRSAEIPSTGIKQKENEANG